MDKTPPHSPLLESCDLNLTHPWNTRQYIKWLYDIEPDLTLDTLRRKPGRRDKAFRNLIALAHYAKVHQKTLLRLSPSSQGQLRTAILTIHARLRTILSEIETQEQLIAFAHVVQWVIQKFEFSDIFPDLFPNHPSHE